MAKYHVACVVTPGHGHVNPALPIVAELVKAGLRVTCITTARFASAFASVGGEALVYRPPQITEVPLKACNIDGMSELFDGHAENSAEIYDFVLPQLRRDPPRLVLHDAASILGRMLAIKFNARILQIHDSFAENASFSISQFLFDKNHPRIVEMDRKLTAVLKMRGITRRRYDNRQDIQRLVFTSRSFQYEGQSFDQSFHFVGPCLRDSGHEGNWQPPAHNTRPIVLISLGTVFTDAQPFYQLCIDAFAASEWHVVMSVGRFLKAEDFHNVPDHIEIHSYVPQLAVLRHARVFISHAGMNSTMESLYHGVPMVLIPQMPEQEMVAKRVAQFGLGKLMARQSVSAETLLAATNNVLRNPYQELASFRMRELLRLAGGAHEAARQILALIHEDQLVSAMPAYAEA